jgi:hypothetical protein
MRKRERFRSICRKVASLRDATNQCWLVGPLRRADLTAFLGTQAFDTPAGCSPHSAGTFGVGAFSPPSGRVGVASRAPRRK